ncbi:RIP metalloprotease [Olsenella sp. HMSC062G07]|uniref:M50 family metallopeptidase n=1 Tax=Olsenella sp. HMSC062G07 TaxID=1739330 RepID=UPI000A5CBB3D|nr:site-2 protease family protein [Olsenella sp. HMSC062G07]
MLTAACAGALSAAFWGVLVLSLLVFVHEGGHYLMARACGMRVTEFFLGMPCRLKLSWKSRRRGTEFGVTPLLLGGYTRICGMGGVQDELLGACFELVQRQGRVSLPQVAQTLGVDEERAYDLLVTLCDWAAIRQRPAATGDDARFETLARDGRFLTEYDRGCDFALPGCTDAGAPRPLVGDVASALDRERSFTYLGKSFVRRTLTLLAGPLVNLLFAFVVMTAGLCLVGTDVVSGSNVVGSVGDGSLAQAAGLQAGDAVVSVDGRPVSDWAGVAQALSGVLGEGRDFSLDVMRAGETVTLSVDVPDGQDVQAIGIRPTTRKVRMGLVEASRVTLSYGASVAGFAVRLIMPQHTLETIQGTSSVVGISAMASEAASAGAYPPILFMALVSMSLGVMNLLPIPPLDGGKVIIELIQLVLRRPLSLRVQTVVSYVGLALFVLIFVIALRNDVLHLMLG